MVTEIPTIFWQPQTEATDKGGFLSDFELRASSFRPLAGDWL